MNRRLIFALGVSIALVFLGIFFGQDLIRELILMPLSYLIWVSGLVYRSIDQKILWSSMLILAVIIALLSLRIKTGFSRRYHPVEVENQNRVKVWRRRLLDVEQGGYLKWRLAQHLSHLILEALAFRTGQTPKQVFKSLTQNDHGLSQEMRAYLSAAQNHQLERKISHPLTRSQGSKALDLPPEEVITFLEEYLGLDSAIQIGGSSKNESH